MCAARCGSDSRGSPGRSLAAAAAVPAPPVGSGVGPQTLPATTAWSSCHGSGDRPGHTGFLRVDRAGVRLGPPARPPRLPSGRQRQQPGARHHEPVHRGVHAAAAGGHLRGDRVVAGAGARRRGGGLLDEPARLGAGAAVLRRLLLLAAPSQPRTHAAVGRSCRPPPEPALQPLDSAAPVQHRRAPGLGFLRTDGTGRRAAGGVRRGRADRLALSVLGAHRAGRQARLVRPLVRQPEQPPRAPRDRRRVPGPQLRRHPDRLGPTVRHLHRGAGALHLWHPQAARFVGPGLGERGGLRRHAARRLAHRPVARQAAGAGVAHRLAAGRRGRALPGAGHRSGGAGRALCAAPALRRGSRHAGAGAGAGLLRAGAGRRHGLSVARRSAAVAAAGHRRRRADRAVVAGRRTAAGPAAGDAGRCRPGGGRRHRRRHARRRAGRWHRLADDGPRLQTAGARSGRRMGGDPLAGGGRRPGARLRIVDRGADPGGRLAHPRPADRGAAGLADRRRRADVRTRLPARTGGVPARPPRLPGAVAARRRVVAGSSLAGGGGGIRRRHAGSAVAGTARRPASAGDRLCRGDLDDGCAGARSCAGAG